MQQLPHLTCTFHTYLPLPKHFLDSKIVISKAQRCCSPCVYHVVCLMGLIVNSTTVCNAVDSSPFIFRLGQLLEANSIQGGLKPI